MSVSNGNWNSRANHFICPIGRLCWREADLFLLMSFRWRSVFGFAIRVVTALFVAMIAIRGLPPIFMDAINDALEALPAAFVSTGD